MGNRTGVRAPREKAQDKQGLGSKIIEARAYGKGTARPRERVITKCIDVNA